MYNDEKKPFFRNLYDDVTHRLLIKLNKIIFKANNNEPKFTLITYVAKLYEYCPCFQWGYQPAQMLAIAILP